MATISQLRQVNTGHDDYTFLSEGTLNRIRSVNEVNMWGNFQNNFTTMMASTPATNESWTAITKDNYREKKCSLSCEVKFHPHFHVAAQSSSEALGNGVHVRLDQSVLLTTIPGNVFTSQNAIISEAIQVFNDGLAYQLNGDVSFAKHCFHQASYAVRRVLCLLTEATSTVVMELAMRTHNNLGLINYVEFNNEVAIACFEVAIDFAKQLASLSNDYKLEYATTLSNWCRVASIQGDTSDSLYQRLKEIVDIRAAVLSWDHPDLAVAYYNIAVVEYSRKNNTDAVLHIVEYLKIASHRSDALKIDDLDKMPAVIFNLLIQHEGKDDDLSHNIVQMLLALQVKRQSRDCPSIELAAILNVVGSLLFKQRDFENSLIFFCEELRLEENQHPTEQSLSWEQTTALCVTCNNIGRIMQELGRFQEATEYYKRVLTTEHGNIDVAAPSTVQASSRRSEIFGANASQIPRASTNLYSTVWYNYGLVQDKLGNYDEAIRSFQMSLKLRQELLGPDHPDVACLLYNIGVLQMEQKELDGALISLYETLRIRQTKSDSQLNDKHIIKAFERLAALLEAKGDFVAALDVMENVVTIQKSSVEFDNVTRSKKVGATLRCISEMLLTTNQLSPAIEAARESVLQHRYLVRYEDQIPCLSMDMVLERVANIEQLVSTLLLLGSLYHEMCEPLHADTAMREAAIMIDNVSIAFTNSSNNGDIPVSLLVMREVTMMLAIGCCAPEA